MSEQPKERKLTRVEKAVLGVMVNPDFHDKTNVERIEAAGVSASQFYKILGDPWFQAQHQRAFFDVIQAAIGPIVSAAIETARNADRDGFNDRKMLLEMSGMYAPTRKVDVTSAGQPLKAFADIDDGEEGAAQSVNAGDDEQPSPPAGA